MSKKKLTRSNNKKLYGVCAGIADYMGWDVSILRILWVVVSLCTGIGLGVIVYLVCALVMPMEGEA